MAVPKETIKRRMTEALGQVLHPDEREEASVLTLAGPSPWLAYGLLGVGGMMLLSPLYVAVTDRRVLLVVASKWSSRPHGLADDPPRSEVSVVSYRPAPLWSLLRLRLPGGRSRRLNVHRSWRPELAAVAAALGTPSPRP